MTLSKLTQNEQILLALVMVSLVLGIYTFVHFSPKNKEIISLQNNVEATQKRLLTTRMPEEPLQNVEELLNKLDDQEQAMALVTSMADAVTERLAPFDSQELKVLISQLARDSQVRIKTNEVLVTHNKPIAAVSLAARKSRNTKRAATPLPLPAVDVILPASRSWIDRMSVGTLFYRPMQRLVLDGSYNALRQFIYGLDLLPWQVTVVKLKIEKLPTDPLRGYAQELKAELVLAL